MGLYIENANFGEFVNEHKDYKIIIYGAGEIGRSLINVIKNIDFCCDINADKIGEVLGIKCLRPDEVEHIEKVIMLFAIKNRIIMKEVISYFSNMNNEIIFFDALDNPYFINCSYMKRDSIPIIKKKIKINIIDLNDGWIITKFAQKLCEECNKMGYDAKVSDCYDMMADVNHYAIYNAMHMVFNNKNGISTMMITHIDSDQKRRMLKTQTDNGVMGICMSKDTMEKLTSWGLDRKRLCYVHPAQDGLIQPKKIVVGITNKCHNDDLRKRNDFIVQIMKQLDTSLYKLKIMGAGWEKIIEQLSEIGVEVEYHDDFNREKYLELMPSLDYWFYGGQDEGAMGYLDALAAGVKTIATPQGYHMETSYGLTYECNTIDDFVSAFKEIEDEKRKIINAVKEWTWDKYAMKHIEIWEYMLHTKSLAEVYTHQGEYMDGIFSVLPESVYV